MCLHFKLHVVVERYCLLLCIDCFVLCFETLKQCILLISAQYCFVSIVICLMRLHKIRVNKFVLCTYMYTKFNQCLASFNSELIMKQCMTMQRLKNILLFYIMKKKQYSYGHHGNTNGCMYMYLLLYR